ncbi:MULTISPECIES: hypothetical protein [Mucilaginibacter]|uniref:Uncharacterized protein n=1 Tax=Mucilaginibacter rubeus TaxID=2027860 RepID=A0A5C1HY21_9SPHI|nr:MULTISPECIES: hypothetical protein [Mucilaginibacter]QEM09748.1 hypothetical protein DEO27_006835 [Mucilaginibacter rubeus]
MTIQIQPNIQCENCIKCGRRPHIEQNKKYWAITCPNSSCKNSVKALIVDFDAWNRLNKKTNEIPATTEPLKRIA